MITTPIESMLFIDIETVSQYSSFEVMPETWRNLWELKIEKQLGVDETPASFYPKRAAILAEFGKIICISAGYFILDNGRIKLRVRSFYGNDEAELLQSVITAFNQWQGGRKMASFCGHNIKEFDIPYLCRRLLVNNLPVPTYLDFQNMKPWETNLIDTLQLWKFGDYKNYTSLNLLAACMNIPSPKDDIDGSMVGEVYWNKGDLARIAAYCQKDVITVAQLILRFKQIPLLEETDIIVSGLKD
jgi:predicted PolB exonuclease-like 3'-5' exonuclease